MDIPARYACTASLISFLCVSCNSGSTVEQQSSDVSGKKPGSGTALAETDGVVDYLGLVAQSSAYTFSTGAGELRTAIDALFLEFEPPVSELELRDKLKDRMTGCEVYRGALRGKHSLNARMSQGILGRSVSAGEALPVFNPHGTFTELFAANGTDQAYSTPGKYLSLFQNELLNADSLREPLRLNLPGGRFPALTRLDIPKSSRLHEVRVYAQSVGADGSQQRSEVLVSDHPDSFSRDTVIEWSDPEGVDALISVQLYSIHSPDESGQLHESSITCIVEDRSDAEFSALGSFEFPANARGLMDEQYDNLKLSRSRFQIERYHSALIWVSEELFWDDYLLPLAERLTDQTPSEDSREDFRENSREDSSNEHQSGEFSNSKSESQK